MCVFVSVCVRLCVQSYFKDCLFDLCALDGSGPILCEAIEAYVNECQDRGVNVGTWRNDTFCRECLCVCVCLCVGLCVQKGMMGVRWMVRPLLNDLHLQFTV